MVCCSVVQCGAVCCSVLHCFCTVLHCFWTVLHCAALCHSASHCSAVWCSVVQCGAVWCNVMRCAIVCCSMLQRASVHCNTLQHTTSHRITLHHTVTHCSTPQHTATHCNTLQQTKLQHTATHYHAHHTCHAYTAGRVTSHVNIRHIYSRVNESYHICEWVMSPIWMRHVTYMNESCHIYEWVMPRIWMSHATYMNESCHIHIACVWYTYYILCILCTCDIPTSHCGCVLESVCVTITSLWGGWLHFLCRQIDRHFPLGKEPCSPFGNRAVFKYVLSTKDTHLSHIYHIYQQFITNLSTLKFVVTSCGVATIRSSNSQVFWKSTLLL